MNAYIHGVHPNKGLFYGVFRIWRKNELVYRHFILIISTTNCCIIKRCAIYYNMIIIKKKQNNAKQEKRSGKY